MKPAFNEKSNQHCISDASVSESLNFEMKAALYRRLRHASEILAGTERDALRI